MERTRYSTPDLSDIEIVHFLLRRTRGAHMTELTCALNQDVARVRIVLDALASRYQIERDGLAYRIRGEPFYWRVHLALAHYGPMRSVDIADTLRAPTTAVMGAISYLRAKGVQIHSQGNAEGVYYVLVAPFPKHRRP